jgi:transcriptional regulator GlxA family with amidase domain
MVKTTRCSILTELVRNLAQFSLVPRRILCDTSGMKSPLRERTIFEQRSSRRVVFLVLPSVQLLDLAGPAQVFDTARRLGASYLLSFCATTDEICSAQHLHLSRLERLPDIVPGDLILIPGCSDIPLPTEELLDASSKAWLQASHQAGAEIASICTGAAALGEAGLLHKRRCTTHWAFVSQLQARYPTAQVLEGVLYVHDQRITTSAGVASGIDMALWLLEQEYGPCFTAEVARRLVVYLRRSGLTPQASVYLDYRAHLDPCVHKVQDWLVEHSTEAATLPDLARVAQISERSLTRAFKAATGITPRQYQQLLRLEFAAQLMNESDFSLETIAVKSGFGDPRHFRRVWHQHFGTAPSSARRRV